MPVKTSAVIHKNPGSRLLVAISDSRFNWFQQSYVVRIV